MISYDKLEVYQKYQGDQQVMGRSANVAEKLLFEGNRDWSVITELMSDLGKVKQEQCSPEAKARTLDSVRNSVEPGALPLLWEMVDFEPEL